MLDSKVVEVLNAVAASLKMNPVWLSNVIMLESSWDPKAYNKSGAVGLIQFMPKTLKDFGLVSVQLASKIPNGKTPVPEDVKQQVRQEFLAKYPDVISQLEGPVKTYFARYVGYPTEQSVYLTVFYPAYRNASLDTVFDADIQKQNPGIKKVSDYVALVQSRANRNGLIAMAKKPLSLLTIAALGFASYIAVRS
jgi:hypothetical protein